METLSYHIIDLHYKQHKPVVQLTDADMLTEIRLGNESVFEQIFRKYYAGLCNYANTVLKDIDESEEVVQAVFLNFWEKREILEISVSLKSYLYKSVYNSSLNKLKHEKIKLAYKNYNAEQIRQNPQYASHLVTQTELQSKIEKAIESLPEQCRLIFKLSRFEELKYAEIAETLGISIKTVENQMGKALKVLREKLADYLVVSVFFILNLIMDLF